MAVRMLSDSVFGVVMRHATVEEFEWGLAMENYHGGHT